MNNGWICPKCGRVYGPYIMQCDHCNKSVKVSTTSNLQNNFEFEYNNKKLWYSRSLAVCAFIHCVIDGEIYVLANKRGPNCEFNKGYWNLPGGFIDFNETAEEAACREALEETGILINPDQCALLCLDTNPNNSTRQTMVARFNVSLEQSDIKYSSDFDISNAIEQTNGEVEEIRWINTRDIDNYSWVRGQKEFMKQYFNEIENA